MRDSRFRRGRDWPASRLNTPVCRFWHMSLLVELDSVIACSPCKRRPNIASRFWIAVDPARRSCLQRPGRHLNCQAPHWLAEECRGVAPQTTVWAISQRCQRPHTSAHPRRPAGHLRSCVVGRLCLACFCSCPSQPEGDDVTSPSGNGGLCGRF